MSMLRRRMMMAASVKEPDVKLISFTIVEGISNTTEVEYNAIEGMTWGEWVNSEYNTEGCYVDEVDYSIAYPKMGFGWWIGTTEYYVFSSEVIQEDYKYVLSN